MKPTLSHVRAESTELRLAWDADSLFREFAPYVAQVSRRLLRRRADVDDVVQDVFFQAMLRLRDLRDPNAVKGWLRTTAVRMCLRRLKRQQLWRWFALDNHDAPSAALGPDESAMLRRAEAVLAKEPAEARVAWILRHVEGERLDAIALVLKRSLATTKRLISRAEQALERSFTDGD